MILLLGGTSEAAPIARGLAEAGYRVLVSTATKIVQQPDAHPGISRRTGPLDKAGMIRLIQERGITAVVDCAHPYAAEVRAAARSAAREAAIPCFTLIRPEGISGNEDVFFAADHDEAAGIACSLGRPVLLTTGSKNLAPYAKASRASGVALIVRVLPEEESLQACAAAGIAPESVVTGRGPFSLAENRKTIKEFGVGVLVTKDSGRAGGVGEKLEAARLEGCRVVVVRRPERPEGQVFEDPADLIAAVLATVPRGGR